MEKALQDLSCDCATLERACSTNDTSPLTISRPRRLEVTNSYHPGINNPLNPNPTGEDSSRCVISVATKLRLQAASLNLEPLLGSMPQHGMGYCTIAQPATGIVGYSQLLAWPYRPRYTGFCLLCPLVKHLRLKTAQKYQPKVSMDTMVQLRLFHPPTPSMPHPAGRTWRSGKLMS